MRTLFLKAQNAIERHDWFAFLDSLMRIYLELDNKLTPPELVQLCDTEGEVTEEEKHEIAVKEIMSLHNYVKEIGKW